MFVYLGRPVSPSRRRHIATHPHLLSLSSVDEGDLLPTSDLIEMDIHERLADLDIDHHLISYTSIHTAIQKSNHQYIDMLITKICDAVGDAHLIMNDPQMIPSDIDSLFPPPASPSCRTLANNIASKALHHINQLTLQHIDVETSQQMIQTLVLLCLEPDEHMIIPTTSTSLPSQLVTYILTHSAWDQQQLRSILTSTTTSTTAARTAVASPLALHLPSQNSFLTEESPHSAHYSIHMMDDSDDMTSHMESNMEAPAPLSSLHNNTKHAPTKSVTIMPLHHIMDQHYQIYDDTQEDVDGTETQRAKRAHEIKRLSEVIQVSKSGAMLTFVW